MKFGDTAVWIKADAAMGARGRRMNKARSQKEHNSKVRSWKLKWGQEKQQPTFVLVS